VIPAPTAGYLTPRCAFGRAEAQRGSYGRARTATARGDAQESFAPANAASHRRENCGQRAADRREQRGVRVRGATSRDVAWWSRVSLRRRPLTHGFRDLRSRQMTALLLVVVAAVVSLSLVAMCTVGRDR